MDRTGLGLCTVWPSNSSIYRQIRMRFCLLCQDGNGMILTRLSMVVHNPPFSHYVRVTSHVGNNNLIMGATGTQKFYGKVSDIFSFSQQKQVLSDLIRNALCSKTITQLTRCLPFFSATFFLLGL